MPRMLGDQHTDLSGRQDENGGEKGSNPTVKQHLAAIRMLYDWLVIGQIVPSNPAHAVRGPRHVVSKGKTLVLEGWQAQQLLESIDVRKIAGLRDRALISLLIY